MVASVLYGSVVAVVAVATCTLWQLAHSSPPVPTVCDETIEPRKFAYVYSEVATIEAPAVPYQSRPLVVLRLLATALWQR
jgi:hypothetical protein